MKIFFADSNYSELADQKSEILSSIREALLSFGTVCEVNQPDLADAIIIQETNSYKDFRYIKKLLNDPLISKHTGKVYTINTDDCATGLLKGLYTCIPKSRFNPSIHVSVPYMDYPNELVFASNQEKIEPLYLASWRGNTKSHKVRPRMVNLFHSNANFQIETTDSWLNHKSNEKKVYIDIIRNAKFSLCPAGWAPVSFRIYESMALGRCPVIIADDFVPPKGPNWNDFALFFPENKLSDLDSFLLYHEHKHNQLSKKAFKAWQEFFCSSLIKKYYASSLLELIQSAPASSKETELKRWNSLSLFWSNKWTVPQRALNKVKKIAHS